jgi:hypothetical protein
LIGQCSGIANRIDNANGISTIAATHRRHALARPFITAFDVPYQKLWLGKLAASV